MNPNYTDTGSLNPGNSQNDVNPHTMRNFNTFPMSYEHSLTARFGDVTPFFVFESEPKDKVPFSSFHEMISDVVPSVTYSKIRMMKDYFSVPYKAILPNTWDLIYANPTHGDDVPEDAICTIPDFLGYLKDIKESCPYAEADPYQPDDYSHSVTRLIKWFFILESFFDDGSLPSLMGCKLAKYFTGPGSWITFSYYFLESLYKVFDHSIQYNITSGINIYTEDSDRRLTISYSDWNLDSAISFRRCLEFMRDNEDFYLYNFTFSQTIASDSDSVLNTIFKLGDSYGVDNSNIPINFSRIIAYQLAYFHFMTNDSVDFIYSADLYRNMMYGFVSSWANSNTNTLFFNYNGSLIQYDVFSGRFLKTAFERCKVYLSSVVDLGPLDTNSNRHGYFYLRGLTALRKSLKYGDYFTGSRPSPLAVGDVNAPVTSSGVSAIDITKNILMQRFLNAVNKTGRKMSDYLRSIRGANTMPLLTDPKFLARDIISIGSQQIENTGAEQGNIVSLLRSEQSKYAFEVDTEDPTIIIGVISFDVPRVYTKTIDRQFFISDRFDMFNPYMQNIGDQEIYLAEKTRGGLVPFSYTLRHMEFKQRYNIASGGFVDNLPTYLFIADNAYGEDGNYDNLSPDFIRSHNTELDRFFPSLNGFALSQYYHFKFKFVNECSPNRNMEYSPTIL